MTSGARRRPSAQFPAAIGLMHSNFDVGQTIVIRRRRAPQRQVQVANSNELAPQTHTAQRSAAANVIGRVLRRVVAVGEEALDLARASGRPHDDVLSVRPAVADQASPEAMTQLVPV